MNNMSKKLDQAYCNECGDLVSYTTKEEVIEDVNNGIPFQYRFPISRCVICGSEVADSLDYNYDKSDARWTAYLQAKVNRFKDMTNGEVIKTMFPSAIAERAEEGRFIQVIYSYFKAFHPIDWWFAPYKEVEDGKNV